MISKVSIRRKNTVFPFTFVFLVFFIISCSEPPGPNLVEPDDSQVIIPEVETASGGQTGIIDSSPIHYYTGSPSDSDIQITNFNDYEIAVNRYFYVEGTAVARSTVLPSSLGVVYHNVRLRVYSIDSSGDTVTKYTYTLPVSSNNEFYGYIYFKEPGRHRVYCYRAYDHYLYPDSDVRRSIVEEGSHTLVFYVDVENAVPENLHYLLPTAGVDCGTAWLREFAEDEFGNYSSGEAQVRAVYEYLANRDNFINNSYQDILYNEIGEYFTQYINTYTDYSVMPSYHAIFIASDMLQIGEGACGDFSELFAALTRTLGYKVMLTYGYNESEEGHMWNEIYYDGRWHKLDSTWANSTQEITKWGDLGYAEFDLAVFDEYHDEAYSTDLTRKY